MRAHANSQELMQYFDTMEFPRVAHIVADLDAIDEELPPLQVPRDSRAREVYRKAPSLRHTVFARVFAVLVVGLLTACASTGATFHSGVGDAYLEHAPFYAGASTTSLNRALGKVGHVPITFQRGAIEAPVFEPESGKGTELAALLGEMNDYLTSLSLSEPLAASAWADRSVVAPDVQFDCRTDGMIAGNGCPARGDSELGRGRQTMRLAVGRPSPEWVAQVSAQMRAKGATQTLVITLELSQYLITQSGWKGSKSVELGTNNVEPLPWLTSLETPVVVLQLTGALMDSTGKAIRIGAEGITAQRTRLLVSAVGGQELFRDEEVKRARTAKRDDLAGSPLAWQVALRQLAAELTGTKP
ncbi:MAG: hypothetical protein ABIY52_07920 [Gemmatimonadaceae bacterium]